MLNIRLLGQFALRMDGELILIPSRPAQSLFAYLALNAGMTHRREKLVGMLWPDSTDENARGYLRSALWRIRKSFDEAKIPWEDLPQISEIELAFKEDAIYQLDADRVLERGGEDRWIAEKIAVIVSLYEGELLPGFYDEWVVLERERIHAAFDQKMRTLLEILLASHRWDHQDQTIDQQPPRFQSTAQPVRSSRLRFQVKQRIERISGKNRISKPMSDRQNSF